MTPDVDHWREMARQVSVAIGFISGSDRESFKENDALQYAVAYAVTLFSEAASRVSGDGKASHPELPWKVFAGMRERLLRQGIRVEPSRLWDTVDKEFRGMLPVLEGMIPGMNEEEK